MSEIETIDEITEAFESLGRWHRSSDDRDLREACAICGMLANVGPSEHTERYGHKPVVVRDGRLLEFDFRTYAFTRMVSPVTAPALFPTLPGKVTGIVGLNPLRLQCGECGEITERTERGIGHGIIASGYHFHTCDGRDGIRRCPDCLAAAVAACPNLRCKR